MEKRRIERDEFERSEFAENNKTRRDGDVDSPPEAENDPSTALRTGNKEVDLPPEFCHYRDEGCEMAQSCLDCPFDKCVYDEPGGKQRWLKKRRAREIVRLRFQDGREIKEIAEKLCISERTVQRDLKAVHPHPDLLPSREKEQTRETKE